MVKRKSRLEEGLTWLLSVATSSALVGLEFPTEPSPSLASGMSLRSSMADGPIKAKGMDVSEMRKRR